MSQPEETPDEVPEEVPEESSQDPGRSTERAPRAVLAGAAAGGLAGVVMGVAEGAHIASAFYKHQGQEALPGMLYLHSVALVALPCLLAGLFWGLVRAVVPHDVGVTALVRRGWRFVRARGPEGANLAAAAWSVLLTLALGVAALVPLCLHFLTAYRNRLLASLALTVSVFVLGGVLLLVHATLRHHFDRWFPQAARKSPVLSWLLGPQLPAGGMLTVVVAVCALVPLRYGETWDAVQPQLLPLVRGGMALMILWAAPDLWLRFWNRWSVSAAGVLVVGALVALGWSYASFGNTLADRRTAGAIARHGPLSAKVLRPLARMHDGDGDGFAQRFGGGDCDDGNPRVNPAAAEIPDNGVDEDCSGKDLHIGRKALALVKPRVRRAPPPKRPLRRRWNVLFILIDAVRSNRVGWSGYTRRLTPNLDRIAARGAVFERAYSVSNKTAAVVPALLTGRFTSELHRTGGHFIAMYNANVTLAERLQKQGYATFASTSHFYFRPGYGVAQGFKTWKSYYVRDSAKMERMSTSPRVTENGIALLDRWAKENPSDAKGQRKPFFMFTYYFDPHKSYIVHKGIPSFGNTASDRYDAEILFTDKHVGRLLEHLKKLGVAKNTVVVVTADHGELFGEHGLHFHGRDLYQEEIHVPLLVYVPGMTPRRVAEPVSLIDVPRTLADLLGVKHGDSLQGLSLVSRLESGQPLPKRVLYTEMVKGPHNPARRAVIFGRYKLIHDLRGNTFRLFDLQKDPKETRNLIRRDKPLAQRLRRLYATFVATQLRRRKASK